MDGRHVALAPWMAGTHGCASPLREIEEKAGQLGWAWYSVSSGLSEQGGFPPFFYFAFCFILFFLLTLPLLFYIIFNII